MTFYDFYTNNVGKKDSIETIEPQNPSHKSLYVTPSMTASRARCARARAQRAPTSCLLWPFYDLL
jgi:hypothetical protein